MLEPDQLLHCLRVSVKTKYRKHKSKRKHEMDNPEIGGNSNNEIIDDIDDNNDDSSSNGSSCIILPSMTINSQSKTPYSDATQVRITGDK